MNNRVAVNTEQPNHVDLYTIIIYIIYTVNRYKSDKCK